MTWFTKFYSLRPGSYRGDWWVTVNLKVLDFFVIEIDRSWLFITANTREDAEIIFKERLEWMSQESKVVA